MHKKERQIALLSLIATDAVASQGELALRLREQGFSVTQASVSRDLDELGIIKRNGRYSANAADGNVSNGFGKISFDTAGGSLIVGRCSSGLASALTVRIDAALIPEVVGTIAGDDTIFIAVKDAAAQSRALGRLTAMFGQGQEI